MRRPRLKTILITALSGLLICALAVGGAAAWAKMQLDSIHRVKVAHLDKTSSTIATPNAASTIAPFNVLLIGSDSRAFVSNAAQAQAFGSGPDVTGQRSDVIKILHVNPAAHTLSTLSIPRDLWVTLPASAGGGQGKINSAFNSGPGALVDAIESNLHIPINHYVSVDFAGFSSIIDDLGGIKMSFPTQLQDSYTGLNVTQTGCQTMNGGQALALVRARHLQYLQNGVWQYDGQSDISRIARQDAFFKAVAAKGQQLGNNPFAIASLVSDGAHALTIDSTWGNSELLSLTREFSNAGPGVLNSTTLPTTGFVSSDGQDALQMAQPYADAVMAPFQADGTNAAPAATTTTVPTAPTSTSTPAVVPTTTTIPANIYSAASGNEWFNPTPC